MTGLPYESTPPTDADWDLGSWNNEFSSTYVQLGGVSGSGECSCTTTKSFYLPTTVNINVWTDCSLDALKFIGWINTTFTVNINGSNVISKGSDSKEEWRTQLSGAGTMVNGNKIKCQSSYTSAGPYVKIHSIKVDYLE